MSGFGDPGQAWDSISPGEPIGWWVLTDDITEYNRENEKLGQRAVINSGETPNRPYAFFELQQNKFILTGGLIQNKEWMPIERCPLEFFVMRGYFATDGQWVTKYFKAFVIGLPSPFNWEECKEPEEYAKRLPGTISMVIAENDPPQPIADIGFTDDKGKDWK